MVYYLLKMVVRDVGGCYYLKERLKSSQKFVSVRPNMKEELVT